MVKISSFKKKIKEVKNRKYLRKKLWQEQKYYEYTAMGKVTNKKYKKIRKADINQEIGSNYKFNKYLFLDSLKKKIKIVIIALLICNLLKEGAETFFTYEMNNVRNLEDLYSTSQLEDLEKIRMKYQDDIQNYAKCIDDLNLSDLKIFVKEMSDMYENIYGYKDPSYKYDEVGLMQYNLYLYNYGVCRQFASDCAVRLNEINPDYNAQIVNVYCQDACINETERYYFESLDESEENLIIKLLQKEFGNHVVVMVTIPNKTYSLIIDPTNPSIGLIDNGKIYMLGNEEVYKNNMVFCSVMYYDGSLENFLNYCCVYIQSYLNFINPKQALKEYSIVKQNEALEEVKNLNVKYREYDEYTLTFLLKDGDYETWTDGDTLIIRPIEDECSTTKPMSSALYHAINLRLKNDSNIEKISMWYYDEDIDINKLEFPKEKMYSYKLDYVIQNEDSVTNSLTLKI